MKDKIKLQVQGLTNSQIQSGAYALILTEESGFHRIPIIVGTAEAQSIAIALEKIIPPRPLSHDLFISFMNAFGIRLCEVFIYKFEDGVFYSQLHLAGESKVIDIDAGAFSGCVQLASFNFSAEIENIGVNAFDGCAALADSGITIPDGATIAYIGDFAFRGTGVTAAVFEGHLADETVDISGAFQS